MRVAVFTLHLHTNYGGMLQAFALKETLQRIGGTVAVIDPVSHSHTTSLRRFLVYGKRAFLKYLLNRKNVIITLEEKKKNEYPVVSRYCREFVNQYIPSMVSVSINNLSTLQKNSFDAIVVGSDQIWRRKYFKGRIEDAYLEFAKDWDIKRISYAASFGTDEWEYNEMETANCALLAKRFDAISVREDSGIFLCEKYLGVKASSLIDPTLLLEKEDYLKLIEDYKGEKTQRKEKLFTYLLDSNPIKKEIVERVASYKEIRPFNVHNPLLDNPLPSSSAEDRTQPPVEEWLNAFDEAEFVVTDSFHAMVFSIIFNKPFIVIGNLQRGMARFESLLKKIGLENRIIMGADRINEELIFKNIDWQHVETVLKKEKIKSLDFLKSNLFGK